ncbi:lITAF domain-containing protein [Halichoeres trimaculatus]|uniref:lITAF domain-containing protein n=1 Tax=Halichoeres trimaculatus TaxID=147232 RepID=UPI003D9F8FC3
MERTVVFSSLKPSASGGRKWYSRRITMSSEKQLPPYIIPEGQSAGGDVTVYQVHTPFNYHGSGTGGGGGISSSNATPVFTGSGGGIGGGIGSGLDSGDGKQRYVSYDSALGDSPGMTTCTSCQQQVMTNVTYKAGTYAWLMCLLFICCGLVLCCCLIPFFMKRFKDCYHTCPRCNRVLHVEKRKCCK